ncbi:MAG: UDP-N-acetylmuramoyl-tripeptide--D-alanyl-D-alanine ligase, partial [Pseudomonadota bacterium]
VAGPVGSMSAQPHDKATVPPRSPAPAAPSDAGARPAVRAPAARPLAFAVDAMAGTWLAAAAPAATFAGAAADSRRVRRGELFFALPGERVDGYDYCVAAVAAGAAAVVVDGKRGVPPALQAAAAAGDAPIPIIGVADPLAALGDLARAVRNLFTGRVVGITGSNGKTTTKELTAAALRPAGAVLRTEGSYNTEIGMPLTILTAAGDEAFWVLEMAMRGRGQIALLADIARPHVGVITNVAGAHLGLLGSIEEVARAKGELFAALGDEGIAILPGGDVLIEAQARHLPESRKLRFDGGAGVGAFASAGAGERPAAVTGPRDVTILETLPAGMTGQIVRYAVRGQPVVARLPLAGLHNARNGAAALAVAAALGLPAPAAALGLADTTLPPHRSFPMRVAGRVVLDDCYNANPASMRAALAAVVAAARASTAAVEGRAFAVLGDMLEIGGDERELHRSIGREAASVLAGLAGVGALGAEIAAGAREAGLPEARAITGDDPVAAARALAAWTRPGDWILVKASRGMRLERAVDALVEEFRKRPGMT